METLGLLTAFLFSPLGAFLFILILIAAGGSKN